MIISDLQNGLVEQMKAISALSAAKILSESRGDIANEAEIAMAQLGLAIIVMTPTITNDQPDSPGANLLIDVLIQISESPVTNRAAGGTGMPAIDVACLIADSLHCTVPTPARYSRLYFTKIELIEEQPFITYHVQFHTHSRF